MTKRLDRTPKLMPEQLAEVERARQEAREGLFATEEELSDVWRRFGVRNSSRGRTILRRETRRRPNG
jgi:muconolactone delta-isomerase